MSAVERPPARRVAKVASVADLVPCGAGTEPSNSNSKPPSPNAAPPISFVTRSGQPSTDVASALRACRSTVVPQRWHLRALAPSGHVLNRRWRAASAKVGRAEAIPERAARGKCSAASIVPASWCIRPSLSRTSWVRSLAPVPAAVWAKTSRRVNHATDRPSDPLGLNCAVRTLAGLLRHSLIAESAMNSASDDGNAKPSLRSLSLSSGDKMPRKTCVGTTQVTSTWNGRGVVSPHSRMSGSPS